MDGKTAPVGEDLTLFGKITGLLPASLKLARKSMQEYSSQAGRDLCYRIGWRS